GAWGVGWAFAGERGTPARLGAAWRGGGSRAEAAPSPPVGMIGESIADMKRVVSGRSPRIHFEAVGTRAVMQRGLRSQLVPTQQRWPEHSLRGRRQARLGVAPRA